MTNQVHATPLRGLKVPNPEQGGEFLPEEGANVTKTVYWIRQENDNSVKLSAAKKTSTKEAKK